TRVWLALAPCWTASLASALDVFDSGTPADEALDRMCNIGVLSRSTSSTETDAEATVYALSSNERASVLDESLADADGPSQLRQQVVGLGRRVLAAAESGQAQVPTSTLRWAILAVHAETSAELVAEFDTWILEAFESRAEFQVLNWMEAARPLAALL